jgi:hypothetical protein
LKIYRRNSVEVRFHKIMDYLGHDLCEQWHIQSVLIETFRRNSNQLELYDKEIHYHVIHFYLLQMDYPYYYKERLMLDKLKNWRCVGAARAYHTFYSAMTAFFSPRLV